ncbi:sigma 54-interacting transcriptional regulator [Mariniflexile gromovii]|uniref:Sigma 54-interacting transcriptional regulator n=1 Tax=Mariniflexile gromovii TaxID=362523 RepID=A0ABS4BUM9_9FLAO|nr:sigma 54-interacting transcriptional regulator [Mariniflexile gromovii]MBP0904299.1 sigma 54-interacting transcriptional regulator [Mariniflexile gromovii]
MKTKILNEVSASIALVKDRGQLLEVIDNEVKKLFYFTHCAILQIDQNKKEAFAFLIDPKSQNRNYPNYQKISHNRYPINTGVFKTVIDNSFPVIFDVEESIKSGITPDYFEMCKSMGLKELVFISLKRGMNNPIGIFCFFSDRLGVFNKVIDVLESLSHIFSIAMMNIIYYEEIIRRDYESSTFLAMSNAIALIRNKSDLVRILRESMKSFINFSDIAITKFDNQMGTFRVLLESCEISNQHPDFNKIAFAEYPINDGLHDAITQSNEPTLHKVDDLVKKDGVHFKFLKDAGIKEILGVKLIHDNEILGTMVLLSDMIESFKVTDRQFLKLISPHFSTAVANVIANTEILRRDEQNEILLRLSNHISSIQTKEHLRDFIGPGLRNHFYFTDSVIFTYNSDNDVYRSYVYFLNNKWYKQPFFEQAINAEYPGLKLDTENAHIPQVLVVEDLMNLGIEQMDFVSKMGIKEVVVVKLTEGGKVIGLLAFLSDKLESFSEYDLELLQRVSFQISIATANLFVNEEIKIKKLENEILLDIGKQFSFIRKKEDLLSFLKAQLLRLSLYSDVTIIKADKGNKTFSSFVSDTSSKRSNDPNYENIRTTIYPFPDGIFEKGLESPQPIFFEMDDILKWPNVPIYIKFLYQYGTRYFVTASIRHRNNLLGVMFLFSTQKKVFSKHQYNLIQGIADLLGNTMANVLANEEILNQEKEKSILLKLSNDMATVRKRSELFEVLKLNLLELFEIEGFAISILNHDKKTQVLNILCTKEHIRYHKDFVSVNSINYKVKDGIFDEIMASEDLYISSVDQIPSKGTPEYVKFFKEVIGVTKIIGYRLVFETERLGCIWINPKPGFIEDMEPQLIKSVCSQIAIALSNILASEKINQQMDEIDGYRKQLEEEKSYLVEELQGNYNYSEIVGSSDAMQKVFHLLNQVAFTNSTVIIFGETGTGKELIARAIHNSSPRKDKLLVKLNCAAIPESLIESELFGHEKGSFTGATERRLGKFELANKGTLFLDEIGEMTLDLQVKLLRALQEKEIERVGGKEVIKTDVRIIAATNRDLKKEVEAGRFRSDLYYRLNVFPITLPPLRERREDIPLLVSHFINVIFKKMGKKINGISHKCLTQLMAYPWPGNIRELEHQLERSILLTGNGDIIKDVHLPKDSLAFDGLSKLDFHVKTIDENERDHILSVLKRCQGKVYGPGGAAELLGVPHNTLYSKMRKLNISREDALAEN